MKKIKHPFAYRMTRFMLAGALNTTINFAVLNVAYYVLHQNKFTAILIATSCAIVVSFMLNRNFVFLNKERSAKKLPRFIAVSVAGVFLVQNSVYIIGVLLLQGHDAGIAGAVSHISGIRLNPAFIDVNLSNLIASLAVLLWNYNGYRLYVFNSKTYDSNASESLSTEPA